MGVSTYMTGAIVPFGVINLHDWGHCFYGRSTCMTWDDTGARMTQDATVTDHISATTTYMIWCEEHSWCVNVLQKVHLYNLVFSFVCFLMLSFDLLCHRFYYIILSCTVVFSVLGYNCPCFAVVKHINK
jgi:hypothetical protein